MILVFRVILLMIMALVWLLAGLIICLLRPFHPTNSYWLTQMLRCARRVIGVKVDNRTDSAYIRGMMPAVLVANHQFNWDIVLMADIPQPGTVCIGKKSLIWTPVFGQLFFLTGNIFIERDKAAKAGAEVLRISKIIREKKKTVWIFPEGHRSLGAGLQPFKAGAVNIASQAGVPILPFVISSYKIDLNRWDNGTVIVKALPPVDVSGMDKKELKQATLRLHDALLEAIEEIDRENGTAPAAPDAAAPKE